MKNYKTIKGRKRDYINGKYVVWKLNVFMKMAQDAESLYDFYESLGIEINVSNCTKCSEGSLTAEDLQDGFGPFLYRLRTQADITSGNIVTLVSADNKKRTSYFVEETPEYFKGVPHFMKENHQFAIKRLIGGVEVSIPLTRNEIAAATQIQKTVYDNELRVAGYVFLNELHMPNMTADEKDAFISKTAAIVAKEIEKEEVFKCYQQIVKQVVDEVLGKEKKAGDKPEIVKAEGLNCPPELRNGNACYLNCATCKYCVLTLEDGTQLTADKYNKEFQ